MIIRLEIRERTGRGIQQAGAQFNEGEMKIARPACHQALQCAKTLGRMRHRGRRLTRINHGQLRCPGKLSERPVCVALSRNGIRRIDIHFDVVTDTISISINAGDGLRGSRRRTVGRVASAGGEPDGKPYHADHQTDHCTFIPAVTVPCRKLFVVDYTAWLHRRPVGGSLTELPLVRLSWDVPNSAGSSHLTPRFTRLSLPLDHLSHTDRPRRRLKVEWPRFVSCRIKSSSRLRATPLRIRHYSREHACKRPALSVRSARPRNPTRCCRRCMRPG